MVGIALTASTLLAWIGGESASAATSEREGSSVRERSITVEAPKAPCPEGIDCNRVTVRQFGPKAAKRALVLMPGFQGGAGDFTLIARDIVERVKGLQVWAVDRRSRVLEDTSMFEKGLDGTVTLDEMYDYYLDLGNIATPNVGFDPRSQKADGEFGSKWGLKVALNDLHAVVKRASKLGKKPILGGHSLGASMTSAYAAWSFGKRPGSSFISGMVLIDGGLNGTFDTLNSVDEAKASLEQLKTKPWSELLAGIPLPEAAGLFAEIGGIYARKDATGSATKLVSYPVLPSAFKPTPGTPTNRGLLGYAFDRDTSPEGLALLHVNAGTLEDYSGDPADLRDWQDGGVTPVARLAELFGQEPMNAVEWYFPTRLSLDVNAASPLQSNAVSRLLGLRIARRNVKRLRLPLYAVQTDLTGGRVLRGARRLKQMSRIKKATLIDASSGPLSQSHLDPLTAAPDKNRFLRTVVPFLKKRVR